MSYFDKVIVKQLTEVKVKAKSKARTIDDLIDQSFIDEIKIASGEVVKSTNGKAKQSWLSDKGVVACKVGVLPLFTDRSGKSRNFNCDKSGWVDLISSMYEAYKAGEPKDDVDSLKMRKEKSDTKNKESRDGKKWRSEVIEGRIMKYMVFSFLLILLPTYGQSEVRYRNLVTGMSIYEALEICGNSNEFSNYCPKYSGKHYPIVYINRDFYGKLESLSIVYGLLGNMDVGPESMWLSTEWLNNKLVELKRDYQLEVSFKDKHRDQFINGERRTLGNVYEGGRVEFYIERESVWSIYDMENLSLDEIARINGQPTKLTNVYSVKFVIHNPRKAIETLGWYQRNY
jgi:hypothetical protein